LKKGQSYEEGKRNTDRGAISYKAVTPKILSGGGGGYAKTSKKTEVDPKGRGLSKTAVNQM